jgi:hypothetical protein
MELTQRLAALLEQARGPPREQAAPERQVARKHFPRNQGEVKDRAGEDEPKPKRKRKQAADQAVTKSSKPKRKQAAPAVVRPAVSPKLIQLKAAGEEKRLRRNRRKDQYYLFIPMGGMASMSMEMLVQEDVDPIALASELGIRA